MGFGDDLLKGIGDAVGNVVDTTKNVVSDVSKGDFKGAAKDAGEGAKRTIHDASTDVAKTGSDLVKDATDAFGGLTGLAKALLNGAGAAIAAAKAMASKMTPADLVKEARGQIDHLHQFCDEKIRGAFPSITFEGKTYTWEVARKDPAHLLWYIAAAVKLDSQKVQKSLFGKVLI